MTMESTTEKGVKEYDIGSSGTAFIFYKDAKDIYFVTNKHVVAYDMRGQEKTREGNSIDSIIYSIGEDRKDENVLDDPKLELMTTDETSDLALLKYTITDGVNPFEDIDYVTTLGKPDIGDDVFFIGYGMDLPKLIEYGKISSESSFKEKFGVYYLLNTDPLPGVSGSPVYEYSNGMVDLVGVVAASSDAWNYTIVLDIKQAEGLLWDVLADPAKEKENLKKQAGEKNYNLLKIK